MSDFKNSKIYIAGHRGMVGSAIWRELSVQGYSNLIGKTHKELDLLDQVAVEQFFAKEKPDVVILAAARVGGIQANIDKPAEFLHENLVIQNNVIHQSYLHKVDKFVFLGSSCIYPRECPQPMKEGYLLTGKLEPTNEGYALAKIAGLKMVEYYATQYGFNGISLMPCNLYGTNDSFDPKHSHVISALVKKFVDAKVNNSEVVMWGTGVARREFMHVDDVARATVFLMEHYNEPTHINVGTGKDISIRELGELISNLVNYKGNISWDTSKPDGMPQKLLDVSKLDRLGFKSNVTLEQGISQMIEEYRDYKHSQKEHS